MQQQTIQIKFDEKSIQDLSSKIASEVVDSLYHELLMARYVQEIKSVQKGDLKALSGKEIEYYLKQKISSLK